MTGARVRVLLVDDHAVVRAGYRLLLKQAPEIEVVAEAATGEQACSAFAAHRPDVVVMDLSLPGISGLEALRRILARDPAARVLVFSMHEDALFVERALAAGARGYIAKSSAPTVLVDAVKRVAGGEVLVDPGLASRLHAHRARGADTPFGALSTREFEIFCLLAEGLSSNDIARRLALSPKTVANYASQIKDKLGAGTTAELARLAIRHGLVRP
ncbi:MAG TPA: response regulator transcription factor [Gammaproteobacteria bacterium]